MKEIVKKYRNNDITVVWKPSQCIHSAICFRGLGEVFNPTLRPWVNIEGASTESIVAQIDKCPSGALSYEFHVQASTASISPTKAEVIANGPLIVEGDVMLKTADGEELKVGKTAFCRCGHSTNKPYCDGSHRKMGFEG